MLFWLLFSTASLVAAQAPAPGPVPRQSPEYNHEFEFPLPIMPVKNPSASYTNKTTGTITDLFEVRVQTFEKRLFPDLQSASLIGYDGIEPGPTFRMTKGREAVVRVVNEAFRPMAVHLHGSYSRAPFDGWAEDVIMPREYKDYYYPNGQARTLWYHDHAVGITSLNVYAGLMGMYIIEDPELEETFDLPRERYDIPLILQSRRYTRTGNITDETKELLSVYGDTFSVNGQILPYLTVEPRKYRFRILNAAASRTFNLTLETSSGGSLSFHVVGSDAGYTSRPVQTSSLVVAMAERWEVVVDFAGLAGTNVTVRQANCFTETEYIGSNKVMQFRVAGSPTSQDGNGQLPTTLVEIPELEDREVDSRFAFGRVNGTWTINGKSFKDVENRILRNVPRGTTEKWELLGGPSPHPVHLHLVDFVILSRDRLPGSSVGRTELTNYESVALKDVVAIGSNETVTILAKYAPWDGVYMFHCHNTVHEDHDMMAVFNVTALPDFGYPESTRFENPMEARFRAQPYRGPATSAQMQSKLEFFSSLGAYYDISGVEEALDEYHAERNTGN